ncbi:MAG: 6-phosphogluconolactonase [Acidobacteria bacterium]|nr:MAG: 6-phosphogluconolactonase [Acidobacteriota bacterium]
MAQPDVHVLSNLEELSRATASFFRAQAERTLEAEGIVFAALSGGSTPRRMYELLASADFRLPWEKIHFFQVDERCVPPDSPQSNYRMVREAFLSRTAFPEANFHRMQAELGDREAAANAYADELSRWLRVSPGEWPRLDLICLGMGPDGHTASLFPGSSALEERKRWVLPNFSERLNSHRLTLTLPVLNAASEIIFLAAGADKAETLAAVLKGPGADERLPASLVRPARGRVTWFVDEAAARGLGQKPH